MSKKEKKRRRIGIRGKLIVSFVSVAILMLIITWVFQIGLLNRFYEKIKLDELDFVESSLVDAIPSDDLDGTAAMLGGEYGVCIRIFEASGSSLSDEIVSVEADPACLLHYMPLGKLSQYYQTAIENGGRWERKFEMEREGAPNKSSPDAPPEKPKPSAPDGFKDKGRDRISTLTLSVRVAQSQKGDTYVIFLNSKFTPMTSTVDTLGAQFWWIAAAGIVFAVLFALIVSKSISSPIVKMNAAAKKLAAGNYEPDFAEEGHKETRELARTLNFAAEEISKADVQRRELIANVSHDLRTPLTMITGYAEMMRDIPGENTPENLQTIIDEANHLSALVNDMLDLSRIDTEGKAPQKQRFSITETIKRVLGRYSALIAHEGYRIVFEPNGEAFVFADEIMTVQVLYNLINNAVNYTGEDKTVVIRQQITAQKVKISISDSGEGISPEHIPYIWDRYYKLDKVHRRAAVGSGLGLSIVKSALSRHGAAFGVESKLGAGSTFWFELDIEE